MLFVQGFVAETKTIHHTRPEILHQYVRLADQPAQDLRPASRLQIEHDATLVAVHHHKGGGFVSDFWRDHVPRVIAIRRLFDLDDVGTHIGEHERTGRTCHYMGEINNLQTSQRTHRTTLFAREALDCYSPDHCGWRLLRNASKPSRKS